MYLFSLLWIKLQKLYQRIFQIGITMKVPATLPFFSENDINYILENFRKILKGDSFLSMSVHGESFEQLFSSYIGTKFGVACNSGTSALELICLSIDVDGKEVILPSNTFLATAIAIIRAGGTPVFADCGNNMCLSSESVAKNITKKPKAKPNEKGGWDRNHARAKACLNKAILDKGWHKLEAFTKYKAKRAGKAFFKVPAPFTSQELPRRVSND